MNSRICRAVVVAMSVGSSAFAEPLPLSVDRIERFSITGAESEGGLTFLGGLRLQSEHAEFGGFSGVAISGDGASVFLVNDAGSFVRARLVHEGEALAGIADARIEPLFPDRELSKRQGDAEDIAFDPSDGRRGVLVRERQANAMLSFELDGGRPTNFQPKAVGADNRLLRSNAGLESVDYAPAASPVAGQIVAIAEAPPRGETDIPGWIAGVGTFTIVRRDNFDVSSARFLPDGDLLLLERRFTPPFGIAARIRRVPGETVRVGARLDGDILLDAGMTSQIDNMEGLAVHGDAEGRLILTLVSDDNYNAFQRTLILQFALAED